MYPNLIRVCRILYVVVILNLVFSVISFKDILGQSLENQERINKHFSTAVYLLVSMFFDNLLPLLVCPITIF